MKNVLIFNLSLLFLCCTSNAFSQRVVEGKILAENNKEAIPYATVQAEGDNEFVYADEKGNFKISISNEAAKLIVSSAGFVRKEVSLPTQAQKLTLDIVLKNTSFNIREARKAKETSPKTEPLNNSTSIATKNTKPTENETVTNANTPKPINLNEIRQKMIYPTAVGEINGNVIMRVLIDEDGNYIKHFVVSSTHPLFIKEVEKHIQEVKFLPLMQNEKPIKFSVNIPFNFTVQ